MLAFLAICCFCALGGRLTVRSLVSFIDSGHTSTSAVACPACDSTAMLALCSICCCSAQRGNFAIWTLVACLTNAATISCAAADSAMFTWLSISCHSTFERLFAVGASISFCTSTSANICHAGHCSSILTRLAVLSEQALQGYLAVRSFPPVLTFGARTAAIPSPSFHSAFVSTFLFVGPCCTEGGYLAVVTFISLEARAATATFTACTFFASDRTSIFAKLTVRCDHACGSASIASRAFGAGTNS
mmetsp:Transcript_79625/g.140557  ORF Transcript_79625/g.140557 Transcript_79625/m.140557 type:complete len:246 (-) Transcript_79625:603-1340(-)